MHIYEQNLQINEHELHTYVCTYINVCVREKPLKLKNSHMDLLAILFDALFDISLDTQFVELIFIYIQYDQENTEMKWLIMS